MVLIKAIQLRTLYKGENMSEVQNGGAAAPAPIAESSAPVESENLEALETEEDIIEDGIEQASADKKDEKAASKETKAEKEMKKALKKYELQVNGKKKAIELDFDNDEEVKKYLSKAMAADEKFEEAAMTRKQAEQLVNMLKQNPLSILRHPELGLDVKALATQILNDELDEMQKTPEQKKLEEMEKQLKDREEMLKRIEEEKRQAEMARLQAEAYQQIDDDITNALSTSDLPKSPYVVKRIADAMIEAVNLGYEDVRVGDIMPYVESQILSEIQAMFEAKPAETMEKLVGKKNLDAYRKSKLTKSKKPVETAQQVKDTGAKDKPKEDPKEDKKVRFKDLFGAF